MNHLSFHTCYTSAVQNRNLQHLILNPAPAVLRRHVLVLPKSELVVFLAGLVDLVALDDAPLAASGEGLGVPFLALQERAEVVVLSW